MGKSANSISNRDVKRLEEMLRKGSANSISNRDVKLIEEAYSDSGFLKRNDGGIARKTRTF